MPVQSVAEFNQFVAEIEGRQGYCRPAAFGVGQATFALGDMARPWHIAEGKPVLDTWYPSPNCNEHFMSAAVLAHVVGHRSGSKTYRLTPSQLEQAITLLRPVAHDG